MANTKEPSPLTMALFEAKPNPMFSEERRAAVRFLRYSQAVPCAACGKRSKHHWTMLVSFSVVVMETLLATPSEVVHLPLMPVCRSHPLAIADWPVASRRRKETPDGA